MWQEFCEGPVTEIPNLFQGNISVMQKLVNDLFLCDGEIHFCGLIFQLNLKIQLFHPLFRSALKKNFQSFVITFLIVFNQKETKVCIEHFLGLNRIL